MSATTLAVLAICGPIAGYVFGFWLGYRTGAKEGTRAFVESLERDFGGEQ